MDTSHAPAAMSTSLLALAALLAATFVVAAVADRGPTPDPDPSPEWTAAEVIRFQVEALQRNDEPYPNAGIATAFEFASPGNKAATGPLDRFTEMVHGPAYRDMLGFERAEYGMVKTDGDLAVQEVTLVHADGRRATYLFGVSRQSGGAYDGCWMTDAVVPRETPLDGVTRV